MHISCLSNCFTALHFVRDNPGEPVPEATFTHSHLWSSIVPLLLHPSTTIHGILPVQSTHLTVFFHNLSPSFLWSTPWPGTLHFILHTFLHPIIVFFSHTDYTYSTYSLSLWNAAVRLAAVIRGMVPRRPTLRGRVCTTWLYNFGRCVCGRCGAEPVSLLLWSKRATATISTKRSRERDTDSSV